MISQVDIQTAVYQALSNDASLPSVYDDVPQGAQFPYIVVGDDLSTPFDDDCKFGLETLITIHVWSDYSGKYEVKTILGRISEVLHLNKLPLNNGYTVTCNFDYQDTFLDPDGVTRHGIIRFRLLTRSY